MPYSTPTPAPTADLNADLNAYRRAIRSSMMDVIERSAKLADRIPAEDAKIQRIAREAHEALYRQESAIQALGKSNVPGRLEAEQVMNETQNISLTMLAELQAIARRRAAFGKTERLPTWESQLEPGR
jgi:hypothetical protein